MNKWAWNKPKGAWTRISEHGTRISEHGTRISGGMWGWVCNCECMSAELVPLCTEQPDSETSSTNHASKQAAQSQPAHCWILEQSMGATNRIGIGLSYSYLPTSNGIFKQSMGARNRVGIGLPYRPARLHSLAELVPWNRFLGSLKV